MSRAGLRVWRRERDSNPRWAFNPYSLSRGAPSATRPPLQFITLCCAFVQWVLRPIPGSALLRASCPPPLRGRPAADQNRSRQFWQPLGHLSSSLHFVALSFNGSCDPCRGARYSGPPALRPFGVGLRPIKIAPGNFGSHSATSPVHSKQCISVQWFCHMLLFNTFDTVKNNGVLFRTPLSAFILRHSRQMVSEPVPV